MSTAEPLETKPTAHLLTIVEVDKADRVICQAPGCGHSVYKRIHVMMVGGKLQVLGSSCFQQLFGFLGAIAANPRYGSGDGRRLTAEERQMLVNNTAEFIAKLEAEHLELLRRAEEAAKLSPAPAQRAATPPSLPAPARSLPKLPQMSDAHLAHLYDGSEMLRWEWQGHHEIADALARYKDAPQPGTALDLVVRSLSVFSMRTPYRFVLDVEMKHFLPKRYALEALHELGLIEHPDLEE